MNQPEILFVYRKVFFEDQWHLKCINCSPTSEGDWNWPENWRLLFSDGNSTTITLPPQSCETTGIPLGPDVVYGHDQVVKDLDSSTRIHAVVAQNNVVVVTYDDLSEIVLPQFLSVHPTKCQRMELFVKFKSGCMDLLPEVREYEHRMRSESFSDNDLAMLAGPIARAEIPKGLLMPGFLESGSAQTVVVYAIVDWRSETEAIVECYVSGDIDLSAGACLKRRSDCLLGSVAVSS